MIKHISKTRTKVLRTLVLCSAALSFFGFKTGGYTIKGNIMASTGTVFYLYYQYNGKQVKDSVKVSSNQFVFKGNLPEPVICTLSNSYNQQIKIFIAENAEMSVSGSVEKFFSAEVKNAVEDALYNGFKQKVADVSGQYRAMIKASGADLHDKTSEPYKAFHKQLDSLTSTFVKNNNSTTAAALAIFDCYLTNPDRPNAKLCYALLSPKGKQSVYARRVLQFVTATERIVPGNIAPGFELKDNQGKSQKLSDYKGKYVFLDFWASWCAPCRAENPNLLKCYQKYANDNLKFVSVSMDASAAQWKQAVAADGLPWVQLNDPWSMNGNLAEAYGVKAIPFNCIIDPTGVIVAVNLRGDALVNCLSTHFTAN